MPDLTTRTEWGGAAAPSKRNSGSPAWAWLHRRALDRLAVAYALLLAVPLIYWPSAIALNGFWTDTADHTYTHGYLVLLTSLWLMFRERKRLATVKIQPAPRAWILLVALSAAWLWLWRAAIQDAHLLLLPVLLFAAVVACLGWRVARVLLFPIAFLYFAMPVWSDINGLLQLMSVKAVGAMLWLTGIPGYLQGDLIQLPSGTLEIAEGCSGLHFFIVGMTLATLYGKLSDDPMRRRLAWLGILGAIALIANWLRIYVIAVAAYLTDMHTFLVPHHYWFGWVIFVIGFFGFLWLAGRLADQWDRARPTRGPLPDASAPGSDTYPALWRAAVSFLCLAALPGLSYAMDFARSGSGASVAIAWPAPPAGWRGPLSVLFSDWTPVYLNASARSFRRYVNPRAQAVEVFTVAYRDQTQNGKLLGYYNSLLGSDGRLKPVSARTVNSRSGQWRQTTVSDSAGDRSVIWSRYRIGDRSFVDPRLAQLWYGIAALTGRPVSSLTALRALCAPSCTAAGTRLAGAAMELQPALHLVAGGRGGSAP